MKRRTATLAALLLVGTVAGTLADTIVPDLRGTWTGTSSSVVLGDALHQEAGETGAAKPRLSEVTFTVTIEGQDGARFWGTFASAQSQEPIVGVIASDGVTIGYVDSDGFTDGKLIDPDTIEVLYRHTNGQSLVAAIYTIVRQD